MFELALEINPNDSFTYIKKGKKFRIVFRISTKFIRKILRDTKNIWSGSVNKSKWSIIEKYRI